MSEAERCDNPHLTHPLQCLRMNLFGFQEDLVKTGGEALARTLSETDGRTTHWDKKTLEELHK